MNVKKVLLKDYSSFKIGGEADMVLVNNEDELLEAVVLAKEKYEKFFILGEGTNTVFADDVSSILFIKIEIMGIAVAEVGDSVTVTANAGELWDDVVRLSVQNGWWGAENLSLIPGTVGAAPVQNIGAYGVELKDILESVSALDRETLKFININNHNCEFGYRDSIFKKDKNRYIITSVSINLNKKPNPVLTYNPLNTLIDQDILDPQKIRDLVMKTRQYKLPDYKLHPNAGSFFKNVVISSEMYFNLKEKYLDMPAHEQVGGYKVPTAWLIENVAQMKGVREGDVGSWSNQPLVLVNYGAATYSDLHNFSEKIIQKIYNETGIRIEREVNVIS